ncbi:MAG: arginine deiminase-related protein [Flavobacteriales bacterium]|nr:arginine deiminase-related protein [Flavobacteriales bacterium]
MMIRPSAFRMNEETAVNNAYQREAPNLGDAVERAQDEFDGVVKALRQHGVNVAVYDSDPEADTPDALFPNNWVSFHRDGRVGLYPMFAANRRRERREVLLHSLATDQDLTFDSLVDFTEFEEHNVFLEGTGSLILDRVNLKAYAAIGPRTDRQAAQHFCEAFGYELVDFTALQTSGDTTAPIYHTNVMLAIGSEWAVVCDAIIPDATERQQVLSALETGGRTVVRISPEQVNGFAGNVLEVLNGDGQPLVAMSSAAHQSFTPEQREALGAIAPIVHAPIPTIEQLGGGSVRCMLAEVFLPQNAQ